MGFSFTDPLRVGVGLFYLVFMLLEIAAYLKDIFKRRRK